VIKININPDTNNFVNYKIPLSLYNSTAEFYRKGIPITNFLIECIYIPRIQNMIIPLDTEQVKINYYIEQFANTTEL
jgi:hypothetical protein